MKIKFKMIKIVKLSVGKQWVKQVSLLVGSYVVTLQNAAGKMPNNIKL